MGHGADKVRLQGLSFQRVETMSVRAKYRDGVFMPVEKTEGLTPDRVYTVFSLREMRDMFGWLKAAETSFDFWNNEDDAVYDSL